MIGCTEKFPQLHDCRATVGGWDESMTQGLFGMNRLIGNPKNVDCSSGESFEKCIVAATGESNNK